ncbi:hypothetical protein [Streptomyces malaysiensis]|uniref:hypothetical protein n=1 Tax=Streptomyces malaysiensis TaxID=92644 RepID=UPI00142EE849|nr:hypothetical protein [Streptomyces malaysiensis]
MTPKGVVLCLHREFLAVLDRLAAFQRRDRCLSTGSGYGVDGLTGQGDATGGYVVRVVVAQFQGEGFEKPSRELVGERRQIDRRDRQTAQEHGVRRCVNLVLKLFELAFQVVPVSAQLGTAFVHIANEVLVWLIDLFQVAYQALALSLGV